MYTSLKRQIEQQREKLKTSGGKSRSKADLSHIMKQFQIFRKLVEKLRKTSEESGTLEDISKYKEADEHLLKLKQMLTDFDDCQYPSSNQRES